jgi:NADH-quinone oxidoreductase subunit H
MLASFFVILWIRSTIPRFRIDQSMKLAWKTLLPLAMFNLFIMAIKTVYAPGLTNWVEVPVYIVLTAVIIVLWARFMRPGRQTVGT